MTEACPPSADLVLEDGVLEDLPALLQIERASYTNPWSAASLREALSTPERSRALVVRTRAESGAGGVLAYCIFQIVLDELHIHNLAVAGPVRRRGLARRLLARAFSLAFERGARRVLLEVRESNRAARELYDALGFHVVGVRRRYYVSPSEDALVLGRTLP